MESKEAGSGALEQFLTLANSSKGLAAAELIKEAIRQPTIFIFGELLDHPNIKALEKSEHKAHYDLLKLFAYGSYSDYKASAQNYPELNEKQLLKLKQLSIVSMAATRKSLPYKHLMTVLEVANVRELEDMIIDCIYAGLINGKLDQKNGVLDVQNAIGRDIAPQDVQAMIKVLGSWLDASQKVIKTLEEKMAFAIQVEEQKAKQKEDLAKQIREKEKELKEKDRDEPMDMNEEAMLRHSREHPGPGKGNRRQRGPM